MHGFVAPRSLYDEKGRFRGSFAVVVDITERKRVEDALRKSRQELEQRVKERTAELQAAKERLEREVAERRETEGELRRSRAELRSLAAELAVTEERERRRLASLLHDRVGQALAVAKMKLGALRQSAAASGLSKAAEELASLVDQSIRDMRSLTFELSPPVLEQFGLRAALEWLAEYSEEHYGLSCTLTGGTDPPMDEHLRTVLFQAARELVMNVIKHAGARHAVLRLEGDSRTVCLSVEDDGAGLDTSRLRLAPGPEGGFGLFSIRERLEHLGGRLSIEAEPGSGTRVVLTAPLAGGPENGGTEQPEDTPRR